MLEDNFPARLGLSPKTEIISNFRFAKYLLKTKKNPYLWAKKVTFKILAIMYSKASATVNVVYMQLLRFVRTAVAFCKTAVAAAYFF